MTGDETRTAGRTLRRPAPSPVTKGAVPLSAGPLALHDIPEMRFEVEQLVRSCAQTQVVRNGDSPLLARRGRRAHLHLAANRVHEHRLHHTQQHHLIGRNQPVLHRQSRSRWTEQVDGRPAGTGIHRTVDQELVSSVPAHRHRRRRDASACDRQIVRLVPQPVRIPHHQDLLDRVQFRGRLRCHELRQLRGLVQRGEPVPEHLPELVGHGKNRQVDPLVGVLEPTLLKALFKPNRARDNRSVDRVDLPRPKHQLAQNRL